MSIDTRVRARVGGNLQTYRSLALLASGPGLGGDDTPPNGDQVAARPGHDRTLSTAHVGSTWTYHVDDQGTVYEKQSSVEAFEDMGGDIAGTMGYRVRETVKASIQLTWYEQTATDVRRHHEQLSDTSGRQLSDEWYSPYLLRVDEASEHLQAGASWTVNYSKTKITASKPSDEQPGRDLDRRRRRPRHRGPGGNVQRAQGHRTDTLTVRPRPSGSSAASARSARHRQRPLRRADLLHHRPVAPSPRPAGAREG